MANPFVHIELDTNDHRKAKVFYGQLLDWQLEDMDMGPMGTYTTIKVGEGTGGGMMQHPMPGAPSLWIPYIQVDDLAASTEKAKKLGGEIIKENVPVAEMGKFSLIIDPTGATFGLWENAKKWPSVCRMQSSSSLPPSGGPKSVDLLKQKTRRNFPAGFCCCEAGLVRSTRERVRRRSMRDHVRKTKTKRPWLDWQRPTLPRLEPQYHGRWGL